VRRYQIEVRKTFIILNVSMMRLLMLRIPSERGAAAGRLLTMLLDEVSDLTQSYGLG